MNSFIISLGIYITLSYIFYFLYLSLEYCIRIFRCYTLPLTLVSFGSGGIRDKYHSSHYVDLRESIIHQQHRIVHIIVIYVFCTLLKQTNNNLEIGSIFKDKAKE